jgi:CHAT domain-containing protein
LLLGNGERLSLADIKEMSFNSVQLLTLSACETAKGGGRTEGGEEVEGLAAIAQQRGAQAVIATLWPVADSSTAALMREFYRLRSEATSKGSAIALQAAQLGLLSGNISATNKDVVRGAVSASKDASTSEKIFVKDPLKPYAHPFFWAPFVLMGNWL